MPKALRKSPSSPSYKIKKKSGLNFSSILALAFFLVIVPLSLGILYITILNPRAATPGSFGAAQGVSSPNTMRIVEIRYYPSGTTYSDTNPNPDLSINNKSNELQQIIKNASKPKGYQNANATPEVNSIEVVAKVNRTMMHPVGTEYPDSPFWHDSLNKILNRKDIVHPQTGLGVSVCDLINDPNNRIDQVWIWKDVATEINNSQAWNQEFFWTYPSNFPRYQFEKQLCNTNRSFVAYSFDMNRGVDQALHSVGHSIEHQMSVMQGDDLFWKKWVGTNAPNDGNPAVYSARSCGNIHYPPNGTGNGKPEGDFTSGYDYFNPNPVQSDCINWKPDGTGQKTSISCNNWSCTNQIETPYLTWWMQNFPHASQGLVYNGKGIPTWWEFMFNVESHIVRMQAENKYLNPEIAGYSPVIYNPLPTSTPTSTTPISTPTPTPTLPGTSPSPSENPQAEYTYILERQSGKKWVALTQLDPKNTKVQNVKWGAASGKFRLRVVMANPVTKVRFTVRVPNIAGVRYSDLKSPYSTKTLPKRTGGYTITSQFYDGSTIRHTQRLRFKFVK